MTTHQAHQQARLSAAEQAVTALEALADRLVCDTDTTEIADEIREALIPWHAADATCLDCDRDTSGCDDCLGCKLCEGGDCEGCGGGIFPEVEAAPAVQPARTPVVVTDAALDELRRKLNPGLPLPVWHWGRAFHGHEIEDKCPCPKQPCGLVEVTSADPDCAQHAARFARTSRQGHRAENCPT